MPEIRTWVDIGAGSARWPTLCGKNETLTAVFKRVLSAPTIPRSKSAQRKRASHPGKPTRLDAARRYERQLHLARRQHVHPICAERRTPIIVAALERARSTHVGSYPTHR